MTPPAITPAARRATSKVPSGRRAATKPPAGRGAATKPPVGRPATGTTRTAGHRSKLRRDPAPHAPRRVSGPVRDRAVPGTPRRAGPFAPRPRTVRAPAERRSLPARALSSVRALPDHALLDRIIRGRAWIPLLGVLLAGIVAMQVEVLKLGASMGRSLELSTTLQSRNELLQADVATLADDQRIERLAAGMGMIMPAPDAVSFLAAQPAGNVASIHPPDASAFTAQLPTASAGSSTTSTMTPGVPADTSGSGTDTQADPTQTATSTAAVSPGQTGQDSTGQTASSSGAAVTSTAG
jgi:hypothetical protein